MDMQGTRQLGVTQRQAWDALNDPATLKQCLPGCSRFEPEGEHGYGVTMAVKIGPVSAKFSGKVTLGDIRPPASYRLAFEGQGGVAGFGKGASSVTLTPNAGGCELAYTVQAQVGGKIAQLGQRLIDGAAKSMADDFFKRFEALMAERHPAADAGTDTGGAPSRAAPPAPDHTPAAPAERSVESRRDPDEMSSTGHPHAIENVAASEGQAGAGGPSGIKASAWPWLAVTAGLAVAVLVYRRR
ncbi:MAG: carbon monoxide dehydrogenase subunit [Variovorax sp.]|nr:carbon monoxide dehydrogenase subunit [Variovorax sp.]